MSATVCRCGHVHAADTDSEDAGCRVCECLTWTDSLVTTEGACPVCKEWARHRPGCSWSPTS
jgi:hypothetical protein